MRETRRKKEVEMIDLLLDSESPIQVDHRHCRPAANEMMLGLRRAAGSLWHGLSK